MSQNVKYQLWIALAAAVVFFTNLGVTGLWDLDEPLYASCAREMWQCDDWVVPRYNGDYFFDKPPLMFWTMIAGFEMFGISEFAARFWSAVLGVGTALLTYHLGRLLFNAKVGLWAGLAMSSHILFTISARAATVDSALTFVTTLAVLLFVVAGWPRRTMSHSDPISPMPPILPMGVMGLMRLMGRSETASYALVPRSWLMFALIYACMGVAVLGKGPVGFLLPVATLGLFLLIVNQPAAPERPQPTSRSGRVAAGIRAMLRPFAPGNFLRVTWAMRPLTAVAVVAAVALPWYVLVGQRTDGLWLKAFFLKYNAEAYLSPSLGHSGPFFYHFVAVLIFFFPWAVFLTPTIMQTVRRIRDHHPWWPGYVLMACWLGVFFAFWSACSTKLPHYVLPAYPALALLTGCFLHDWLADPARVNRRWIQHANATLVFVGAGILIVVPIVAYYFVPGEQLIGLVGLTLVAGGAACWHCHRRGRLQPMMAAFAVTSVAFITAVFAFAANYVDRHQNSAAIADAIRADSRGSPQLAGYRFLEASMVYYAGGNVPCCENVEQVGKFLAESPQAYLVTIDEHAAEIEEQFPGEFRELTRQPRFLKRNREVVVFARRTPSERQYMAGVNPPGTRQ
jgi:4-amino-4-deoxy-L-arabinose transferase-like glycosyltransferase